MPSLGIIIGLPVALLLIVLGAVSLLAALRQWVPEDCEWIFGIGGIVVVGATVVASAFFFWPYSWDYHHWSRVDGTVAAVSSRLVAGDKATNQKFVVRLTDGRVRGVDDTRASLLKPGDPVHLQCKRSYVWASNPGWDCHWNG